VSGGKQKKLPWNIRAGGGDREVMEEIEMNRARLVKRDEAMERKETRQLRLQPGSSLGHSCEIVKAWISGRQSTPRPSPREIFAALFVPQQAE
jgi:hypothetical protein